MSFILPSCKMVDLVGFITNACFLAHLATYFNAKCRTEALKSMSSMLKQNYMCVSSAYMYANDKHTISTCMWIEASSFIWETAYNEAKYLRGSLLYIENRRGLWMSTVVHSLLPNGSTMKKAFLYQISRLAASIWYKTAKQGQRIPNEFFWFKSDQKHIVIKNFERSRLISQRDDSDFEQSQALSISSVTYSKIMSTAYQGLWWRREESLVNSCWFVCGIFSWRFIGRANYLFLKRVSLFLPSRSSCLSSCTSFIEFEEQTKEYISFQITKS